MWGPAIGDAGDAFPGPVLATHAESHQEHTIRRTEGEVTGAPLPYHLRSSLGREPESVLIRHNREMPPQKLTAIDSNALPWEERPNDKIGRSLFRKNLVVDEETGMEVRLVRYPAGAVNPLHTHTCAHGMYVLEGTLVTHDGEYGPGHFVWFPEGSVMEHGATADHDVTVLFITNKPFEIHYQ